MLLSKGFKRVQGSYFLGKTLEKMSGRAEANWAIHLSSNKEVIFPISGYLGWSSGSH